MFGFGVSVLSVQVNYELPVINIVVVSMNDFSIIINNPITILITIMHYAPTRQASCRLPPKGLGVEWVAHTLGADELHFGAFEHAHPATLIQKVLRNGRRRL